MELRLLFSAFALLLWSLPASAQTVRALIMDPATGAPSPGGYVLLLDEADTEIGRLLNGQDGLLALRAPAPGNYRLASVRVGFHPSFSDTFAIAEAETVDLLFDLAHEPIDFSNLTSSDENVCAALDDGTQGAGILWGEIAKALTATQWTGRDGLEYYSLLYERDVEPASRRVLMEQSNVAQGLVLHTGVEPDDQPFIVSQADGGIVYNPPSIQMLLSEPFVRDYCFRVERTANEAALHFQPKAPGDDPGIAGTLSVDLQTGHLTALNYQFFNVPFAVGEEEAHGMVSFMPGPSDRWLADAWRLQTPLVGVDDDEQYLLAGVHHIGGLLAAVVRGEEILYSGPLSEVTGVVRDGPGGSVLAGAEVELVGTSYTATTDDAGNFRVAGPLDGAYAVTFNHPVLDSLGVFPPDTVITVNQGQQQTLALLPIAQSEVLRGFVDEIAPEPNVVDRGNRPLRTRNVITREHLASMMDLMCLEIVRRMRPDWLQDRGAVGFGGNMSEPVVFRNGKFAGGIGVLNSINPDTVDEIWYFSRIDATQRWGSSYGVPVIEVHDRARR